MTAGARATTLTSLNERAGRGLTANTRLVPDDLSPVDDADLDIVHIAVGNAPRSTPDLHERRGHHPDQTNRGPTARRHAPHGDNR